jgi:hypothetical protein
MKKFVISLLFAAACLAANAQSTANEIKVPSGYQGHIEYSNLFYLKGGGTSMDLSTTHGFYYTPNMFVGIGIGVHAAPGDAFVPVYAAAKYIFNYKTRISPTLQMRMGSFFCEGAKPYGDLSFGLRFASDRDFAFSIQACASYYAPFDSVDEYWDINTNTYTTTTNRMNLSCVGLRLGIEW